MKPQRIQLRRSKGWRKPEGAIVVARPGRWGNPFKVGGTRYDPAVGFRPIRDVADAVDAYRQMIDWDPDAPWWDGPTEGGGWITAWGGYSDIHNNRKTIMKFLAGSDLACWCRLDQPCHADVLLEIANQPECAPAKVRA